ncbi:cob(I)yrinic acid a,c-diamide adenosyltransferase [Halococcus saccharolyticus]|uniref:ATP:corrinoid adenosyltransferase BtuR/CobO/CobP n=1 Tax=Halococcus saccharolyticus DSM 5350 TaxID=1227455 RepID=M0MJE4_9EURY|nr:cob(I)yrinic acid a,c-diamide adenosyltransferase [Halococcus saccharolyticus]EMA44854.1 ATP:corrinoid adenosyltransferase BtuR/CobO/CobP [Halococcus saccharolyticus DSM 5350]
MTDNSSDADRDAQHSRTPGEGKTPESQPIEPSAPDEFGLVSAWWGDGKGKTTAALGMGFRAAGHGYRVHLLQFMKGGAASVEATRGEYNAIDVVSGFTYENSGHYGWHGLLDGSADDEHAARAQGALERARELVAAADEADLTAPLALDGEPDEGVHLLILDEILYAANRDLVDPDAVADLVDDKPDDLELVLTGGHERPAIADRADLVTNVRKEAHPFDAGHRARKGTEY